jgi:uncharacterized protein YecE (DUF72 family)
MAVRVGPAGWSYEDWKGVVYPPDMPKGLHPAAFLARYFDCIEVNSPFYRPPQARHAAAWVEHVAGNDRFQFTVKLWRRFTHDRESWPGQGEINAYRDGIAPLVAAGRLGCVLVQFPWSFKRTVENRTWLARVIGEFSDYPLALEIRHASWDRPEVYEGLRERGVAFCNIDQPLFNDSIEPSERATAPVGYVRLHGRNAKDWFRDEAGRDERYDYLYGSDELAEWLKKIQHIRDMVDELYVITNNHYAGQAVVNAFELQSDLGLLRNPPPACLVEKYPRLEGLGEEK